MSLSQQQKNKGFTLIELIIVIAIISLLTSIVLSSLSTTKTRAENAKYTSEMISLRSALYLDRSHNGLLLGSESQPLAVDLQGVDSTSFDSVLSPLVSQQYISYIPHYSKWPIGSDTAFTYQYSQYKTNSSDDAIVCGNPTVNNASQALVTQEGSLLLYTTNPDVEMLGITPGIRVCDDSSCAGPSGTSSSTERIYCLPI